MQPRRSPLSRDDPTLSTLDPPEMKARRRALVDALVRSGALRSPRVVDAFLAVPRHVFVPLSHVERAYEDMPLPIGLGQTISQPTVVAMMTEALELDGTARVLEVGTGSGYQAALLARLAGEVWSIERVARLSNDARARLALVGADRVALRVGDGHLGWPDAAPFDRIVVTAAPRALPPELLAELGDGGVLVAPVEVGPAGSQELVRVRRRGAEVRVDELGPVQFVPLVAGAPEGRERWS
jgi:protein-L-isoaspartate(D-aspartate) O-methyltransferase